MKKISITTLFLYLSAVSIAQSKEAGTDREAIKQYMHSKNTTPSFRGSRDEDQVKAVLKQYNNAIEKLDVSGTQKLFTDDSKIYESGGSEGTYAHYLEHHLEHHLELHLEPHSYSDSLSALT